MIQAPSPTDVPAPKAGNLHEIDYRDFCRDLEALTLRGSDQPLFTTDATGLWEAYLESFPPSRRQHHNCNACRRFVERFGGLVTIDSQGKTEPFVWDVFQIPGEYREAFNTLFSIVKQACVTGVFLSPVPVLGEPLTGVWRHMAARIPDSRVYRSRALTAGQAMAEKVQDYETVWRALGEWDSRVLDQAVSILESDALSRSEKVLGSVKWLRDLEAKIRSMPSTSHRRRNTVWRWVAEAPAGFCHPRASMAGTLLDDLAAGKPFEEVKRAFNAKMHPAQYQRPQAPPAAGNIAQAEALVAKLGIERSLERRFARLEEVETVWKPRPDPVHRQVGGVFGHIAAKSSERSRPLDLGVQTTTWVKFERDVLPRARTIAVVVPYHGNFGALVTAVDLSAPPILQWDSEGRRNPFSRYLYVNGSPASHWGLVGGSEVEVTGIAHNPPHWQPGFEHHGNAAMLILKGARDRGAPGLALFPEILKSELHGVRAVIEAHSGHRRMQGSEDASACGISVEGNVGVTLKVSDGATVTTYRIDRWE